MHAQCTHQFPYEHVQHVLKGPFQISYVRPVRASVPDLYAQGMFSFLLVSSAYALVPDAYDQRTHKDRSIRISLRIFFVTFKIPKTAKNITETSKCSQKLRKIKKIVVQIEQKSSLKLD